MKDTKFVDAEMFKKIAEDEGLYYAALDYVSVETVSDMELMGLIYRAQLAMGELKKYVDYK